MKLSGLHLLLTYHCTLECDHCFVWGSPSQSGTMSLVDLRAILDQAADLVTIETIYFEGGEPFLYYATLLQGVQMAAHLGFGVGIVSNAYWATSVEDAVASLKPFAGLIQDLSISSDRYHWSEPTGREVRHAQAAAAQLGIPIGTISIAQPEATDAASAVGQLPLGETRVMYRGRAACTLAQRARQERWTHFTACLDENLREPGRVHVDPFGNVHVCQGISLGNLVTSSLRAICDAYDPDTHAIVGPLLHGGPVELVRRYGLPHADTYADECHLCDAARRALRDRFPDILLPDQMYGVAGQEPAR
jgi:hypothetical protein